MRRRKIPVVVLLALLTAHELWASDVKSQIQKGVELHDAGDFEAAVQVFRSVIEIEPENTEALYELANTYFAIGDFESCISTARIGLKYPSDLDVGFYTIVGTCYSSSGKTKKALKSFRSGLDISPENASLNFNTAVTLLTSGDRSAAIEHLETAIHGKPSYASPYYLLGEIYRQDGARVQSLFYFTRFFTLESSTSRAVHAATAVLDLLSSGIEVKSESDVEVTIPTLKEEDPMSALELSLSIAGLSVHTDEVAALPSEAHRKVAALTTFFQIVLEMSEPDDEDLRSTLVWRQAIAPVLRIHQREGSEALGFVMALRANVDGAAGWVEANPQKIQALNGILGG